VASNPARIEASGGTTTVGLYHFAATDDVAALEHGHLLGVYTSRDGLKGDQGFHIFEDSQGTLWFSTRDRDPARWGFCTWDRSTRTFHNFSEADGFPSQKAVSAFAEDQSGSVWLGLQDGGVLRYSQGRFSEVAADLAPSLVTAMHADREGRIWIASSQSGKPSSRIPLRPNRISSASLSATAWPATTFVHSPKISMATFTSARPAALTGWLRISRI
jgi:hypothetical protein